MKGRRTPLARRKRIVRRRRATKMRNEVASCKETHEFALLDSNTAYLDYQTSLARCERASTIAKGYQEYRITKVEYHFVPLVDTYLPGQYPIPQLYAKIDKSGALGDVISVTQMVQSGAKPRRFDDKNIVYKFKPAVLQYARDASNGTNPWAKPMTSPWLSTNHNNTTGNNWTASSIDHLGIVWVVDCKPPAGQPVIQYTVREVIHYQFRKANVLPFSSDGVGATQAPSVNTDDV